MSGTEDRLGELESRVAKLEAALQNTVSSSSLPRQGKSQSIKEFLMTKSASTANDRALVMGYFLENSIDREDFTADEIKECFRRAKIPAPKNVNDVVNKNIAKGFMMESGSQRPGVKSWVLTMSGEQHVEGKLSEV